MMQEPSPSAPHWSKIGKEPHHGFVAPLFSLHSMQSCGIGEYLDLLHLIPWCASVGMDVIQLLPMNNTGRNSSPYSSLSAIALNPWHLSLWALPGVKGNPELEGALQNLRQYHTGDWVLYDYVWSGKGHFLELYMQKMRLSLLQEPDYAVFCKTQPWLRRYAAYKVLKEDNAFLPWYEWPEEQRHYNTELEESVWHINKERCEDQCLRQYLCYMQMQKVRQCAEEHGILLFGDIPILISRDSADVWSEPELFDPKLSVGAPADYYSNEGQNWGVPLFNWESHRQDHYRWWRDRLHYAENFYHIYRIDHVVGLFRLWAIPPGHTGKDGFYIPNEWNRWIPEGEERLRMMLSATSMLPIGEDLGTVPPQVRHCLSRLGICGTKVMRWERQWSEDRRFIEASRFPELSLCCVSTHDAEPLRMWWQRFPEEVQQLCRQKGWHYQHDISEEQHLALLQEAHEGPSIFRINPIQEYLSLFKELRHADPAAERVNTPGVVSAHNWSSKLVPCVEELIAHTKLADTLRHLTKAK